VTSDQRPSDADPVSTVPSPAGLYTTEDLLGGWAVDDPLSYAATLDARVFSSAAIVGLRVPASDDTARRRALHDHAITWALNQQIKGRRVVAFMGGPRLGRNEPAYALVADIAWRLSRQGYLVVSGGGPGAMEAAHLGARLSPASPDHLATEETEALLHFVTTAEAAVDAIGSGARQPTPDLMSGATG